MGKSSSPLPRLCYYHVVILLFLLKTNCAGAQVMSHDCHGLASYSEVKGIVQSDREFLEAMEEAKRTVKSFIDVFSRREPFQTDFIVVAIQTTPAGKVPIGILVEQIRDRKFFGRAIPNSLSQQVGYEFSCEIDQVIDWRYIDTFELVGGHVYRVLYDRQDLHVRQRIAENQQFFCDFNPRSVVDEKFRTLIRSIAHRRYEDVERQLIADASLRTRECVIPIPGLRGSMDRRVKMSRMTASDFVAEFGDAQMVEMLYKVGALKESKGWSPPLVASSRRGNLATTRAMLDLGFDVEVVSENDVTPLRCAVFWNHEDVVALLLDRKADPNQQDNGGQTSVFHVKTLAIAELLLRHGARVDVLDDKGRSCVEVQLEHGRSGVADLLVKSGAKRDIHWKTGLSEQEAMRRGIEVVNDHFRATPPFDRVERNFIVDFGTILAIKVLVGS